MHTLAVATARCECERTRAVVLECRKHALQHRTVGIGRAHVLKALVHANLVLLVCRAQADGGDHCAGFFRGFRPYVDGMHAETVMSQLVCWVVCPIDGMEPVSSGVAIGSIDDMGRHRADERSWRNREEKSRAS